jgi:hypothetical protein
VRNIDISPLGRSICSRRIGDIPSRPPPRDWFSAVPHYGKTIVDKVVREVALLASNISRLHVVETVLARACNPRARLAYGISLWTAVRGICYPLELRYSFHQKRSSPDEQNEANSERQNFFLRRYISLMSVWPRLLPGLRAAMRLW